MPRSSTEPLPTAPSAIELTANPSKRLGLCLAALAILIGSACSPDRFQRLLGGPGTSKGEAVALTLDGGYVVAGSVSDVSSPAIWRALLVKTDPYGVATFTKVVEGDVATWAYAVAETSDGGFIVCGGHSESPDREDVLLLKTNSQGSPEWMRTYPATPNYSRRCSSAAATPEGGYVFSGESRAAELGDAAFVLKTDPLGNHEWVYNFTAYSVGAARRTASGGYVVVGRVVPHALAILLDATGQESWSHTYTEVADFSANSVAETEDGGFLVAGFYNRAPAALGGSLDPPAMDEGGTILRLDAGGSVLWTRDYPDFFVRWAALTSDGGAVLVGRTVGTPSADVMLMKTTTVGEPEWTRIYGTAIEDKGTMVTRTPDGGYVLTGQYDDHAYLAKTDASGDAGPTPLR